jgi:hypothetical protein
MFVKAKCFLITDFVITEFHFIQSNLCTTTTLGATNVWPLLTGGRCSEVVLCYEDQNWDSKMVVVVGKMSLDEV